MNFLIQSISIISRIFFQLTYLFLPVISLAVLKCTPQSNGACAVVSMDAVTLANEEIIVDGQPSTYTDTSITNLEFFDNYTLKYVPTGVFTIFPNLKFLVIRNCGTTTLITDAYKNCNNLEFILLEGGNIPNIPARIASTCSSVLQLSLNDNKIASIDVNAFQGLTNLTVLLVNQNQLTCIPPTLFLNSRAYYAIFMRNNFITAIDYNIISGIHTKFATFRFIHKFIDLFAIA